ncbi:MAG: Uma2 family endonuclease [Bryobacterales bacterium]|nr:Uma2 family endonuclease [Bryobacterales bacterium]
MGTAVGLMTVEEFRRLPEREDVQLELRAGEVVAVTRPKKRHDDCVYRMNRWLMPLVDAIGRLEREFSYRALPEYELRVADLAYVPWDRWDAVDEDDNLHGAPDFAVEVASPSNSAEELLERRDLCLDNGCTEFWIVYPKLKKVAVSTQQGEKTYRSGDVIPFTVFSGHSMPVDAIFTTPRR